MEACTVLDCSMINIEFDVEYSEFPFIVENLP